MAGIIAPYGPFPLRGDSLIALSVTHSACCRCLYIQRDMAQGLESACLLRTHLDRFSLFGAASEYHTTIATGTTPRNSVLPEFLLAQ